MDLNIADTLLLVDDENTVADVLDIAKCKTVTLTSSSDACAELTVGTDSDVSDSVAPGMVRQDGSAANAFEGGPPAAAGRPRRAGSICEMSDSSHKKTKQSVIPLKATYLLKAPGFLRHESSRK